MHCTPFRLTTRWWLAAALLLVMPETASANFYELLRRIPDSANTIILIDVERLLMSPIAMREKWRDRLNSPDVQPLHFPADAVRYLLASKLDFVSNLENLWDAALVETTGAMSLPYLAKQEGGYLDEIEGQQVAFSLRNAFFVSFQPTILGAFFPANRQDLARWLRMVKRREEPQVSDYLRNAVALIHGKDQMVVAFDLGDLLTSRQVRDWLRRAESLAGKEVDLGALTKLLVSVQGVTLTVSATERLDGAIRIEVGESPAALKGVAKALIFEVLEHQGMLLDEMKDWAVVIESKAVLMRGRMTTQGLRTLTDLIPIPAGTLDLQTSDSKAAGTSARAADESASSSATPVSKATASKKYYQHISLLLEQTHKEVTDPNVTPKIARRIVDKAAKEIDRLPVLNVDEELIAFGTGVSEILRNMRNLSKNASLDASYRQATIAGDGGYGYGYGGFYGGSTGAMETSVMRKQMTSVLKSNQLEAITMLQEKSAEIRKKMSLKYQVEF
jgi:hypothetical protein